MKIEVIIENTLKYDVIFEEDFFNSENISLYINKLDYVVFYDEHYDLLMNNKFSEQCKKLFSNPNCQGIFAVMTSEQGKEKKDIDNLTFVLDKLSEVNINRRSIIIAIGGGVLLDIIGTASQLFRRSIDYIKIPTTLIGQIDAGIGIKTAINYKGRKNLIGSFYPPVAVINCMNFIYDLNVNKIECGFSEIIKVAIVADAKLIDLLESFPKYNKINGEIIKNDPLINSKMATIIQHAAKSLIELLKLDLYEKGNLRRAADFGHTFSTFIEEKSSYNISHGYAVALDMLISIFISLEIGLLKSNTVQLLLSLFDKFNLISETNKEFFRRNYQEMLMYSMESSIKHRGGDLNYAIPIEPIGNCAFINLYSCKTLSNDYVSIMNIDDYKSLYYTASNKLIKYWENN